MVRNGSAARPTAAAVPRSPWTGGTAATAARNRTARWATCCSTPSWPPRDRGAAVRGVARRARVLPAGPGRGRGARGAVVACCSARMRSGCDAGGCLRASTSVSSTSRAAMAAREKGGANRRGPLGRPRATRRSCSEATLASPTRRSPCRATGRVNSRPQDAGQQRRGGRGRSSPGAPGSQGTAGLVRRRSTAARETDDRRLLSIVAERPRLDGRGARSAGRDVDAEGPRGRLVRRDASARSGNASAVAHLPDQAGASWMCVATCSAPARATTC